MAGAVLVAAAMLVYRLLLTEELPVGFLYLNGQLEATEVRVAAEVQGRILRSELVEGRKVGEGDLLVTLDREEFETQLAGARAEAAALDAAKQAIHPQLRTWRHHLHTATTELERTRELRTEGVISERRVDQAEDAYEEARGRIGSLEAELRQLEARREAATQRIARLEILLDRTTIRSPIEGTILTKAIEVGEFATPGRTIAVVADLSRMELRAFVPQDQIGKVRLGSDARIRIDAFPERTFGAEVAQIDDRAQFTPREVHVPEERVRLMFGVTLNAMNPDGHLKPGMPADAWIRWTPEATWPDRLPVPR